MEWQKDTIKEVYERNFSEIYRLCYLYMRNREEALDMVQEVFMRLLKQKEDSFQDQAHIDAWLRVTACNRCKDELRCWWKRKRTDLEDLEFWHHAKQKQESEAEKEKSRLLLSLILELPEKYRVLIYFHYYEGYTMEELGEWMHSNPSTLRSRLAAGKKLLKEKCKEAGIYER